MIENIDIQKINSIAKKAGDEIIRIYQQDFDLVNCLIYGSWLVVPLTIISIFNGLYRGFKQLQYPVISNEIIRRIVFSIIIITIINMGISIFISYKFKSNLDEIMFEKYKRKIKAIFA